VSEFFSDVLNSVPYGCAFSLVAVGLVLTFRATGIFNFAFAAEAYAAAVVYAVLCGDGLDPLLAAGIVVLVMAPLFGALLDFGLFSRVPAGEKRAKLVMALGLMVVLPQVVLLVIGNTNPESPPAPFLNSGFWEIGNVPILGFQACEAISTAAALLILAVFLRTRRYGLPIRAAVESPRLLELSGVDSKWVIRGAWMISTAVAALAGVIYAPTSSGVVQFDPFSLVLVASIAAAALGGLRSLPLAGLGGVLLGIAWGLEQAYVPSNSIWYSALVPSLPFFILIVLLVVHPAFRRLEDATDPMAAVEPPPPVPALALRPPVIDRSIRLLRWPLLVLSVLAVVLFVPDQWNFSLTVGASLGIIFLSITLLTGLGGQLSLAQAMFAGIGGFTTAQLADNAHFPILLAALCGALVAGISGWAASLPALRFRGLPVALLTLCLALLGDNLLFTTSWVIGNSQNGINLPRPSSIFGINFASVDSEGFFVLTVVAMVAVAGVVNLLLRGTTGRALTAVDSSALAAAGSGVRVRRMTINVFMLSAGIAGLGGAFFAMTYGTIMGGPGGTFIWFYGPTFLVIVVTVGATTVEGAITAGLAFALMNQAFTYLPTKIGGTQLGASSGLTIAILSLGAFTYAKHPEGIFEWVRRRVATTVFRAVEHRGDPALLSAEDST
jgi:branched-subunit amino acid ABC-type transport system permease component